MASNHTPNYNLCQWEPEDKVLRTDFNEDNRKIDRALAGMASGAAVSGLQGSLDALSATVSQHTAALEKKGNCQLYTTSYVGSGNCNSASPNVLTFPKKPLAVLVTDGGPRLLLLQGIADSWSEEYSGSVADVAVAWSGNSVRWYTGHATGQLNLKNNTYFVFALLQAD